MAYCALIETPICSRQALQRHAFHIGRLSILHEEITDYSRHKTHVQNEINEVVGKSAMLSNHFSYVPITTMNTADLPPARLLLIGQANGTAKSSL